MTDNDIKKALECCSSENGKDDCLTCPNFKDFADCKEDLSAIALDLINRQQAEIEKLNVELVGMRGACESYKMHYDKAQTEIEELRKGFTADADYFASEYDSKIKSEAIKEFWEKLKIEARLRNHTNYGKNELATAHNEGVIIARKHTLVCGDNLVKEMTEVSK